MHIKIVSAWNQRTGERTMTFPAPGRGKVYALCASPGWYVSTTRGSRSNKAHILLPDEATATLHYDKGHWLKAIVFSPDIKKLAYTLDTVHIVALDPSVSLGDQP
jgi:hypothetical protein